MGNVCVCVRYNYKCEQIYFDILTSTGIMRLCSSVCAFRAMQYIYEIIFAEQVIE